MLCRDELTLSFACSVWFVKMGSFSKQMHCLDPNQLLKTLFVLETSDKAACDVAISSSLLNHVHVYSVCQTAFTFMGSNASLHVFALPSRWFGPRSESMHAFLHMLPDSS